MYVKNICFCLPKSMSGLVSSGEYLRYQFVADDVTALAMGVGHASVYRRGMGNIPKANSRLYLPAFSTSEGFYNIEVLQFI